MVFFLVVFALYAEIQDGRQKWQENDSWEKWLLDSANTLLVKNFIKTKMATKNGQENDFRKKSPVDPSDTPQVKNFVKIGLSHTIPRKMHFCILRRNSRWPPKMSGKRFLGKVTSKLGISPCFRDKHVFAFNAEIQNGRQK